MRRWIMPCSIIIGLAACLMVVCGLGSVIAMSRLAESLPTPLPTVQLTLGKQYWIGALIPPPGLPQGLLLRNIDLYNKPADAISDPGVTIISVLNDATIVKLKAIQDQWCYVEAKNEFGKQIEGWLRCNRLLDYQPTPVPTPNRTPQKP